MGNLKSYPRRGTAALVLAGTFLLAACSSSSSTGQGSPVGAGGMSVQPSAKSHPKPPMGTVSPVPAQKPVAPEVNPPGDIPDSIAYVPYTSKPGGFKISTPEGWNRINTSNSVTFTDKLNTVVVSWQPATSAPSASSVKKTEIPQLKQTELAFTFGKMQSTHLPAGPAVFVEYQANSTPDRVTGKQYRLDVQRYSLFHNGQEIVISLRSPLGSDNVDPWRIITESFAWT